MNKKVSRLRLNDLTETKQRLGERELSDVQLKLVGGGAKCQGGTSTFNDDTDE